MSVRYVGAAVRVPANYRHTPVAECLANAPNRLARRDVGKMGQVKGATLPAFKQRSFGKRRHVGGNPDMAVRRERQRQHPPEMSGGGSSQSAQIALDRANIRCCFVYPINASPIKIVIPQHKIHRSRRTGSRQFREIRGNAGAVGNVPGHHSDVVVLAPERLEELCAFLVIHLIQVKVCQPKQFLIHRLSLLRSRESWRSVKVAVSEH